MSALLSRWLRASSSCRRRLQISPVAPARERVREAAADQARAIDRILEAEGRDDGEVVQEVGREMPGEPAAFVAAEIDAADDVSLARQRKQRDALETRVGWKQRRVIGTRELPEPRPVRRRELRGQRVHRVDEQDAFVLAGALSLGYQQVPDFVLGIREHERDGREPITRAQTGREALEQRVETVRLEQLHLTTLRSLPGFLVLASLVRERCDSAPQVDELAVVLVHVTASVAVPQPRFS